MPTPDYVITKAEYDEDHSYLQRVKRWEYDPDAGELRDELEIDRDELIYVIEDGYQFYTAPRDGDGNLQWGREVEVLEIKDQKYVRNDSTPIRQDNLGDIEEYPIEFGDEDES